VITSSDPLYEPPSGFVPLISYLPAMSGAGALLVLVVLVELELEDELLFLLSFEGVPLEVDDLPTLQPRASTANRVMAAIDLAGVTLFIRFLLFI